MDDPFATCKAPSNVIFPAGHEFIDPETGQGYRLKEDAISGGAVRSSMFEAFNAATETQPRIPMPKWLKRQVWPSKGSLT